VETQSLHNVGDLLESLERTTGEPGDLDGTLHHIAQTAQTFFRASDCVILAINPITGSFITSLTVAGDLREKNVPFEQPGAQELAQQVLKEGVLLVENLDTMPAYQSTFTRLEDMHAFAGLALRTSYRPKPLGVLYVNFRHPQQFNLHDRELFQLFAEQTSFILQETWLLRRQQEVARIGQEINQELDTVTLLFQKLQKHAAGILDISHTLLLSVYQRQTNTAELYLQEEGCFIHEERRPLEGACQYAIETRQTLFIEHLSLEAVRLPFQIAHIPETEPKESFIFVPLMLRDEPLGVLSIQHPEPHSYDQGDRFILELLANPIALALHNIRLYRSLYLLNETGEILTQQLDAEQTLQATVEKIRDATKADLVVLYPYESAYQRFMLPPRIAGTLLDPTSRESMSPNRPGGTAKQIVRRTKPIFAKQSTGMLADPNDSNRIRQGSFGRREQIRSTAAMPLRVGEEVVGALFINFRQPQRFDAIQKLFIEGLAHYAAIAIKNAQTFGSLSQRRLDELVILQHIDRELSRTLLDLESFLNTLLKLAYERVPAEEAAISLYNPRTQMLEVSAAIGPHAEVRRSRTISLHQARGIVHWVLEHKRPARVNNVHEDPQWCDLYVPVASEIVSELDVPILDDEEVVGILNFESTRAGAFHREDEEFLATLAGQAVLAIKNAQAYEREKRLVAEAQMQAEEAHALAEETQALNAISREITSQLDLSHVFDLILEKALALTHSTLGSLHLYDPERGDLWMAVEHGAAEDRKDLRLRLRQGIVGYAAAYKSVLNVPDVSQPPWDKIYIEFIYGTRSELAAPMLEGDEIRGVLNIESPLLDNFNASDERLLQGLADLAVVALQNVERFDKARREAQRFALLYKAGQELGKISEFSQLDQAYDTVLHLAEEHSQCKVVIRRYDDETQELVLMGATEPGQFPLYRRTKLDEGVNGQVAQERRTIVIQDTHNPPPDVVPPKLSDPMTHSLVITPIFFKDRYYGNLRLSHEQINHFHGTDILFFEGLAQQLASTIYRLETTQEHYKLEQRAIAAEAMSSIGQAAFELTHRLGNDLGLVRTYVNSIRTEFERLGGKSLVISEKLEAIVQAVRKVLDLSKRLKQELLRWGEAKGGEPVVIHPSVLLEEASELPLLPSNIQIDLQIDPDVNTVCVMHGLITDILHNLITNAIEAMPGGGKITLRARNAGRSVALEVSDTGSGIAEKHLSRVFDLFFSTKESTGFGLWSARRNALSNHGELTVKSEPGKGTTFTLLLPKVEEGL